MSGPILVRSRRLGSPVVTAAIRYEATLEGVDWDAVKADLAADDFDNGRTPEELCRSFAASHAVVVAWDKGRVVGTARLLADGVCNAYLVDVWTLAGYRRRGIGSAMVLSLLGRVPGHHVALFTEHHVEFYRALGFEEESTGMSLISGRWLNRGADG
jgi:GNAT superfamily N-acetyltransferase